MKDRLFKTAHFVLVLFVLVDILFLTIPFLPQAVSEGLMFLFPNFCIRFLEELALNPMKTTFITSGLCLVGGGILGAVARASHFTRDFLTPLFFLLALIAPFFIVQYFFFSIFGFSFELMWVANFTIYIGLIIIYLTLLIFNRFIDIDEDEVIL